MLKKLTQNQLIGLVTGVFVLLVVGVLAFGQKAPDEVAFDENSAPPVLQIDTGYNATLSGEPFYIVTDDDEKKYDSSLDVCDDLGSHRDRLDDQNGWYQVVAYEDNMKVEDVIFTQMRMLEGTKMIAVIYDNAKADFRAIPNKIIKNGKGQSVELLEMNDRLKKGTVVAVSANKEVDFCTDYSEVGNHTNVGKGWNLVSRPEFANVDYRAIWEVAFAKGGNSNRDLTRYYPYENSNATKVEDLPSRKLYWVYGGQNSVVTGGGDYYELNLYESNSSGAKTTTLVPNNKQFEVAESNGSLKVFAELDKDADANKNFEISIDKPSKLEAKVGTAVASEFVINNGSKGNIALTFAPKVDSDNTDDLVTIEIKDKDGKIPTRKLKVLVKESAPVTNTLNGKVIDAVSKETLAGVTVVESGKANGTQTTIDGLFTFNTTQNSIELDFSFVGYQPKKVNFTDFAGQKTVELQPIQGVTELGNNLVLNNNKIDKNKFIELRGINQGDLIADFDANKIIIDKKVGANWLGNISGDKLEVTKVNGNINDGYALLRVKLDGQDWEEGEQYRVVLREGAVVYKDEKISPANSTGLEFNINVSIQENIGPNLSLVSKNIASTDFIKVQIPNGYDLSGLCISNGACSLKTPTKTYAVYSSTNGLYYQKQSNLMSFLVYENQSKKDFEIGDHTLVIDGAKYTDGSLVPQFEETFKVLGENEATDGGSSNLDYGNLISDERVDINSLYGMTVEGVRQQNGINFNNYLVDATACTPEISEGMVCLYDNYRKYFWLGDKKGNIYTKKFGGEKQAAFDQRIVTVGGSEFKPTLIDSGETELFVLPKGNSWSTLVFRGNDNRVWYTDVDATGKEVVSYINIPGNYQAISLSKSEDNKVYVLYNELFNRKFARISVDTDPANHYASGKSMFVEMSKALLTVNQTNLVASEGGIMFTYTKDKNDVYKIFDFDKVVPLVTHTPQTIKNVKVKDEIFYAQLSDDKVLEYKAENSYGSRSSNISFDKL